MSFAIQTLHLEHGARLGICALPGRGGAGLRDMGVIFRWTPTLVISMTETIEMERHNMGDLGAMLQSAGINWSHFPIRDFAPPEGIENWPALSARAHTILDHGNSVLAHCYGGQGRSGMVLLRLMVERGLPPETALKRLRAARPGAVETDAQFAWAAAGIIRA